MRGERDSFTIRWDADMACYRVSVPVCSGGEPVRVVDAEALLHFIEQEAGSVTNEQADALVAEIRAAFGIGGL